MRVVAARIVAITSNQKRLPVRSKRTVPKSAQTAAETAVRKSNVTNVRRPRSPHFLADLHLIINNNPVRS